MPRRSSPSFVLEVPLKTTPHDERLLDIRFAAAQKLYNACVQEALRRLFRMWESAEWQAAKAMPKQTEEARKARGEAFAAVDKQYGFTEATLHAFAARTKNPCWIAEHLGANEAQKIATRAFRAAFDHCIGKRGKPRFKPLSRLRSIEGKTNAAGIMWKGYCETGPDGQTVFRNSRVQWGGLSLRAMLHRKDGEDFRYQAWALSCPVKYVRVVRRMVKGRWRYYAQLVLEGHPYVKERHRNVKAGVVGVDTGPSMAAAVGDDKAELRALAPSLSPLGEQKKRIQRLMDRSLRATNPNNYHADGRPKKGQHQWVRSQNYLALLGQLREIDRRLRETRRREHGELCHCFLQLGNLFRLEKTSGKALQKLYGKAVLECALMDFLNKLKRKAERSGGGFEEFDARNFALSQFDHKSGLRKKKPLSLRWQDFGDGSEPVQRDLYSANLARYVGPATADAPKGTFDTTRIEQDWAGAEPRLRQAVSEAWAYAHQPARGRRVPSAFGFRRPPAGWRWSQSGSLEKEGAAQSPSGAADARGPAPR